jgi:hypothetical protein
MSRMRSELLASNFPEYSTGAGLRVRDEPDEEEDEEDNGHHDEDDDEEDDDGYSE